MIKDFESYEFDFRIPWFESASNQGVIEFMSFMITIISLFEYTLSLYRS